MDATELPKGLRPVAPVGDDPVSTSFDIIAIHGLGTESPRTWEFKNKQENKVVNWLSDPEMLPAAVPEARIFTYDWNANLFKDAPVETLLGHADTFLGLVANTRRPQLEPRPIIFIASCFGGLILAEAINRAAQKGSIYEHILLETAGIVFLATPFQGSDAAPQARWKVLVAGIMGEQASDQLIDDLEQRHDYVRQRVQRFTEIANAEGLRLPLHCFYETKTTELLKGLVSGSWAARLSNRRTRKLLVTQTSACLDGFDRHGLNATHSGMNKFQGPECPNFKLVKDAIVRFATNGPTVLGRRKNRIQKRQHFIVPFGRNKEFIDRGSILDDLLERIPPGANQDDCQRTAIDGLGGVGKTQIALEAAFRIRDAHEDCSVFWVPAVDATSFVSTYRAIGQQLKVQRIDDEKADVKELVKVALSESPGTWLLIIDNADDSRLLFGDAGLAEYLPSSERGSILFTTRNHQVALDLVQSGKHTITVQEMSQHEALEMLDTSLEKEQMSDMSATVELLEFLANLPLAIRQASAYMAKNQISTTEYLTLCKSSDKNTTKLLSENFEDRHRYKNIQNPVATTWLISFLHISDRNPLAADYLRFMCFLAEKDIPQALLPPADTLEAIEAIGTLKSYAFVTQRKQSDAYDMHRLVRISMRSWLVHREEHNYWATTVIQHVESVFPFPAHENRAEWMRYLPHAQQAFEFRHGIEDEIALARLLRYVGLSLSDLNKAKGAEAILREAVKLSEEVLGREHAFTLICMDSLANVLRDLANFTEAEALHRQAFELSKRTLGGEHIDTLACMNNLANVLNELGLLEESENLHRQALQLAQKTLGGEHPITLSAMQNLATVRSHLGKHEDAEQILRQTLELWEKVLGREDPKTLDCMYNLACTLGHLRKVEEAEQIYRQILELMEKVHRKEHPKTLHTKECLASFLRDKQAGVFRA